MSKDNPYQGYHAQLLEKLDWLDRENVALKQRILDDNKAYGCELRDSSGTIRDHAKQLERENAALNHALNIAQTELRLNGCAKAADEVAKLHDAARKEAQP